MLRAFASALLALAPALAIASGFSFAVIPHPDDPLEADAILRKALHQTDTANLAFVVVDGIKAADEACSDALYDERRALLRHAQNGVVVSLAADDWTGCKDEGGQSTAIERLSRLRELFFPGDFSFGASRIPLARQSTAPRFRSYVENARWEMSGIMFATIDLPADNNHCLLAAGRNSEFEDRVIANRNWLHRLFSYARYQRLRGVVLFADANPLAPHGTRAGRDGYLEIRRQLQALSRGFRGRVLIVHNPDNADAPQSGAIAWHGRLGEVAASRPWTVLTANTRGPLQFSTNVAPSDPTTAVR